MCFTEVGKMERLTLSLSVLFTSQKPGILKVHYSPLIFTILYKELSNQFFLVSCFLGCFFVCYFWPFIKSGFKDTSLKTWGRIHEEYQG